MDVLYYIGGGSMHHNNELKYSLRALEKHCKDLGKVWVVGNKPEFLQNVEYIWVEDKDKWWKNAFLKTIKAIENGISDKFLLMNDDFYMLEDFKAETYPAYYHGEIPQKAVNPYQEVIINTARLLKSMDKPTKHYGIHCPIMIEAEKYKTLAKYMTEPVSVRCLYGNLFCKGQNADDCKCSVLKKNKTKCFSSTPWAPEVMAELQRLFPERSRFEKEE